MTETLTKECTFAACGKSDAKNILKVVNQWCWRNTVVVVA